MTLLRCSKCGGMKEPEAFYLDAKNTGRMGRKSHCRVCAKAALKDIKRPPGPLPSDPTRGGMSAAATARALGISKQRVAQVEAHALAKLRRIADILGWDAEDFIA